MWPSPCEHAFPQVPLVRAIIPHCIAVLPSLKSAIFVRHSIVISPAYGRLQLPVRASLRAADPTIFAVDSETGLDTDTIVAIVTGVQEAAVSIVRLSGIAALDIASAVFRPASQSANVVKPWDPETHRVYYGHAFDASNILIDEVLTLVMRGPRSYTAEDVVEIHTHGGGVCARRVVQACVQAGARLARPGEFTLRAFLNGRLDLTQAEAIASLIGARTVAAADSALAGLGGGVGREISEARADCVSIVAEIEARLDFDEDLPPLDVVEITQRLKSVRTRVEAALATARQGQLLRTGMQVALVGRPNVGKSSLLNALSGTDRAIVTDIAGTTRDVVESGVVVGGIPVTLLDTAGLREAEDQVERIGVQRSVAVAKQADVVVVVADGGLGWTADDAVIADMVLPSASREARNPPSLLVLNKIDLLRGSNCEEKPNGASYLGRFSAVVRTSATTGEGLDELRHSLLRLAGAPALAPGGVAWSVNERQAEALTLAAQALERVEATIDDNMPVDFWTIDLRAAVLALGEVSGDEIGEEVLNTVFSRFCIGK